jgi:hypothetical protein
LNPLKEVGDRSQIPPYVMPGLDPGIHQKTTSLLRMMDCRVKPGNDTLVLVSTDLP